MSTKQNTSDNPVKLVFDSLTDEQLRTIVTELRVQYDTGTLPSECTARDLIRTLKEKYHLPGPAAYDLVQLESLRRAAFKWAAVKQCM